MANYKTKQQEAFEELEITNDELNKIGEAFKKEEFRKLFYDYITEITDPEYRETFEKEFTELERERGNDVTFIYPEPGYVIKTSIDGREKVFINVCSNENIGKPMAFPDSGRLRWSIPYSQAPPRDDLDKSKKLCLVCDVVFHPEAIRMASENKEFKEMLSETAMNAVEESYNFCLDKQNKVYPKVQFKGLQQSTIIRRKSKTAPHPRDSDDVFEIPNYPYPLIDEDYNVKLKETFVKPIDKSYTTPKYVIIHRRHVDFQDCTNNIMSRMNAAIPNELVVEVDLPLIKSAPSVTLDVTEKSLKLISEKPAKYKLEITLPYNVNEDKGNAKFDCSKKKLIITLVVKKPNILRNSIEGAREDSGVDDSDLGSCCHSRSTESSSSEDERTKGALSPINEWQDTSSTLTPSYYDNSYDQSKNHYYFPKYNLNKLKDKLSFIFHVENVIQSSLSISSIDSGLHFQFDSIGFGYFPFHYSFCIRFPSDVQVYYETLNVDVWENNVIGQMFFNPATNFVEYFCGFDKNSMTRCEMPDPFLIINNLQKTENLNPLNKTKIEVTKFEEDNVVIEISSMKVGDFHENEICNIGVSNDQTTDLVVEANEEVTIDKRIENVKDSKTLEKVIDGGSQPNRNKDLENEEIVEKKAVGFVVDDEECKTEDVADNLKDGSNKDSSEVRGSELKQSRRSIGRSLSESQSDKSNQVKSILKVGRSLSESSADHYNIISSSKDYSDPDGSEKTKKTVRFSDSVSKKTYRPNSSILGQKKKNQRKSKNKKRSLERRASESENSEAEQDETKYSHLITDEETSESQSDVSQSDVSESDDGMKPEYKPEDMALTKRHNHKRGGKKSARKSAFTAKMQMELL